MLCTHDRGKLVPNGQADSRNMDKMFLKCLVRFAKSDSAAQPEHNACPSLRAEAKPHLKV